MLELFFAGLWPIIGRLGFGVLLIAASLAVFFTVPIPKLKRIALWVAGTTFVIMIAYSTGVVDEKNRNSAREHVVVRQVEETASADRDAVDSSIKSEPRRLRADCLAKKAPHDRC